MSIYPTVFDDDRCIKTILYFYDLSNTYSRIPVPDTPTIHNLLYLIDFNYHENYQNNKKMYDKYKENDKYFIFGNYIKTKTGVNLKECNTDYILESYPCSFSLEEVLSIQKKLIDRCILPECYKKELTNGEKNQIGYIIDKYIHLSSQELTDEIHKDIPVLIVDYGQEIPYESICCRLKNSFV